jgi:hypothetical protein
MPATVTGLPDTSIDPSKLYRSDEIACRMGWRPSGWRAARRAGLKALRYGKRWFVKGAHLIEFVEQQAGRDD